VNRTAPKPKKVVLAYSGGLDTSIIIPWLKENYGCEVIAMIGDVGQQEDLQAAYKKALATGRLPRPSKISAKNSSAIHLAHSSRRCRVRTHLSPRTSMARPVIAKRQAEIALKLGADGLSHGCHRQRQRPGPLRTRLQSHRANVQIIAPGANGTSTPAKTPSPTRKSTTCPSSKAKEHLQPRPHIWHLSHEGGELEDPANAPAKLCGSGLFLPEKAPDKAEEVEIGFESGTPVSVNGTKLGPVELLNMLNEIAARHGVGRTDLVENRLVGMKSRGAYELPAALCSSPRIANSNASPSTAKPRTCSISLSSLRRTRLQRRLVLHATSGARRFLQRLAGTRHRLCRPQTLERFAQRHQPQIALLSLSRRPRQLHHGPLQPKDAEGFIHLFALPVTVRPKAKAESGNSEHLAPTPFVILRLPDEVAEGPQPLRLGKTCLFQSLTTDD